MINDQRADIDPKSVDDEWHCERDSAGRFVTTDGRKRGSRNAVAAKSARSITDLHDLIFSRLRDLIDAGNPETVRWAASALLPSGGRAIVLADLSPQGLADAVASAEISPLELTRLAQGLRALKELQDMAQIQDRLTALERLLRGSDVV